MGFLDNIAGQDQARRYQTGAPEQQQLPSDDDHHFQPSRVYNPYDGLSAALDNRLRKDFTLPNAPEFIFTEEASVKRRSWSENLTYYTGVLGVEVLELLVQGTQAALQLEVFQGSYGIFNINLKLEGILLGS
eukprot:TRINITY_DN17214_c0_g2_i2.p3 TRINITY_DN17214_c0_g2~~TRINITY_DN17214_c0_g2_i2.p3  ORF type:complete len:132 (-),score=11.75 TRINITY_DN17214_c0_g2_i2:882-1277(-)